MPFCECRLPILQRCASGRVLGSSFYRCWVAVHWSPTEPGVLRLPSGRLVRGRGLGRPLPDGPTPTFTLFAFHEQPPPVPWAHRWLLWPDLGLPGDDLAAANAFQQALERAVGERVEVACWGGMGRTGTALACLTILDGLPAARAVAFVREHCHPLAVETPDQGSYVARFTNPQAESPASSS